MLIYDGFWAAGTVKYNIVGEFIREGLYGRNVGWISGGYIYDKVYGSNPVARIDGNLILEGMYGSKVLARIIDNQIIEGMHGNKVLGSF